MSLLQMQRETKSENGQKPNLTGIPSYMKQDFEARSGLSYDDVRIHYSSPKPAELGALAYTQGSHVYIGPGQERHLPHELVHVAQQKRGEARPTGSLGGVSVNDDPDLERQADAGTVVQRAQAPSGPASQIVQRKIGMEYQTVGGKNNVFVKTPFTVKAHAGHGTFLFRSNNIEVTADGPDLEYVTPAVDTPEEALAAGRAAAGIHQQLMAYEDANLGVPGLDSMEAENVEEKVDAFVYDKDKEVKQDTRKRSWMCTTGNGIFVLMNIKDSAHPQATVGIRMNKIADLLLYLGGRRAGAENKDLTGTVPLGITTARLMEAEGKTEAQKDSERMELLAKQKQTMRNAPRKAMEAIIDYVSHHPEAKFTDWDSVWGLISLLFAYHAQFLMILNHPSAAMIAKDAMPVMNRTSLYDAYLELDKNDRGIFLAVMQREIHIKHPERWSKTTYKCKDPLSKEIKDVSEIILAGKFEGMKGDSEVWDFLKLDEWVNALAVGVDAMYNRFHSIGGIANQDAENPEAGLAKFNLKKSTDIGLGNDAPGLLVELRGLERGVPSERWGEIAWRVAYLIRCLNDGKIPDASKVPDFSKDQ